MSSLLNVVRVCGRSRKLRQIKFYLHMETKQCHHILLEQSTYTEHPLLNGNKFVETNEVTTTFSLLLYISLWPFLCVWGQVQWLWGTNRSTTGEKEIRGRSPSLWQPATKQIQKLVKRAHIQYGNLLLTTTTHSRQIKTCIYRLDTDTFPK